MKRLSILILVFILILSSCRKLVTDKFPEFTPVPTMNAMVAADSILKVHISIAEKMAQTAPTLIQNANVKLFVDGNWVETLVYDSTGYYTSTIRAQYGKQYKYEVQIPEYPSIESSFSLPSQPKIIAYKHINIAGKNNEGQTYPAVKITIDNRGTGQKYYELALHCNAHGDIFSPELIYVNDPILLNEGLPIPVFSNELMSDTSYTLTLNYTTGSATGDGNGNWDTQLYPIVIELRSLSYDLYKYRKQLYLYEQGRYPEMFAGAYTFFPLYSNVKGGYGIVGAYSGVSTNTIYPNKK